MPTVKKIKKGGAPVKIKKSTVKPVKTAMPKKSSLAVEIYNFEGKSKGSIDLPKEIFKVSASPRLLAQYVRVYLANQRQGTQSVKSRGEVVGSTRKIYKQKGTGRARHGDRKAPLFVGGGAAHAPHPRDFSLKMNKKQKRKAFRFALSLKHKDKNIHVFDDFSVLTPKTSNLTKILNSQNFDKKAKCLIIYLKESSKNLTLAGRNIENIGLREISTLNTYDILLADKLIFAKDSLDFLNKKYANK